MHHRTKQDAEQGQALVEFALTIPIFLFMVFGIIDLGRLIFAYAQVIDAARQGVRWGIVEGLDNSTYQYLDCAGIEAAALDTPGLVPASSLTIDITYRDVSFDTDDPPIWDCDDGNPSWGLLQKYDYDSDGIEDDREAALEVTVRGSIKPMTPVLAMFANSFSFDYTAERTIAEQAYYTEEWPSAPPVPQNFHADPDCTTGLVSFGWNSIPVQLVDSFEIRDSITDEVVALPSVLGSTCNGCDTISTTDGWRMYYLVVILDGMESTASNDDTAVCEDTGGGGPVGDTVNITVEIWHDSRNPKQSKTPSEDWIPGLTVKVFAAGGPYSDLDLLVPAKITDANGKVVFNNVPVNSGFFEIRSEYPLLMSTTTSYPPVLSLSVGQSGSTMIGFSE